MLKGTESGLGLDSSWQAGAVPRISEVGILDAALWLLVVPIALTVLFLQPHELLASATLTSAIVVACLYLVSRAVSANPGNLLLAMFVIVYALFHFGILPVYFVNGHSLDIGRYFWFLRGEYVDGAHKLSVLFLVGLVLPLFFSARPQNRSEAATIHYHPQAAIIVPILLLLEFVWLAMVVIYGDVTNYVEYNAVFRESKFRYSVYILVIIYPAIAAVFLLGVIWSPRVAPVFAAYMPWAVIAFFIGLRGEVLFPLAISVPILQAQGRLRMRWPYMLTTAWVVLVVSSFVREFRNQAGVNYSLEQTSALNGLAELGGSLRPAFEVQRWIDQGLEHFYLGGTYWAPVERALGLFVPFMHRLAAIDDMRLMNVAIVRHTQSNLGFSFAAEAFINFGYAGCLLIGLVVGATFLRLGESIRRGQLGIIGVALIYSLFYHIRQSFVGAVATFILFTAIGFGVWFLIARYGSSNVRGQSLDQHTPNYRAAGSGGRGVATPSAHSGLSPEKIADHDLRVRNLRPPGQP